MKTSGPSSMNRPTPTPPRRGKDRRTLPQFPSWEGLGVGSWSRCAILKSSHEPSEPPPGFGVRWLAGNGADTALAHSVFEVGYWLLAALPNSKAVCALTPH